MTQEELMDVLGQKMPNMTVYVDRMLWELFKTNRRNISNIDPNKLVAVAIMHFIANAFNNGGYFFD